MEAIILAGGLGSRLRSVVHDVPKPMADVNGKPFLEYLLQWMSAYPFKRLVLAVGYKHEAISDYFGDNFNGIELVYAIEESPLGTGGAVAFALKQITDKQSFIINADTYFPIDLQAMWDFHNATDSRFTIALKKMLDFDRYGTVILEGENVTHFNEKMPCKEGLINGGIYLVQSNILNNTNLPKVFSLEKEVLELDAKKGLIKGKVFDNEFIDIGIPEDYFRVADIL